MADMKTCPKSYRKEIAARVEKVRRKYELGCAHTYGRIEGLEIAANATRLARGKQRNDSNKA